MRHVPFDPSNLPAPLKKWWEAWSKRAAKATRKTIATWEGVPPADGDADAGPAPDPATPQGKVSFNGQVWSDLKEWLLENVFHLKCAYCETFMPRHFNAAEHFRPKGGVTDGPAQADNWVQVKDPQGNDIRHPGYFWLAYQWKNLVPSCDKCNSGEGKQNQFPVGGTNVFLVRLTAAEKANLRAEPAQSVKWPDHYYLQPDDLDAIESPLLLNPFTDRPQEHIRFGDVGIETSLDERGKRTIDVCKLSDEKLRQDRQLHQEMAWGRWLAGMGRKGSRDQKLQSARDEIQDWIKRKNPYSAAALDYIDLCWPGATSKTSSSPG